MGSYACCFVTQFTPFLASGSKLSHRPTSLSLARGKGGYSFPLVLQHRMSAV